MASLFSIIYIKDEHILQAPADKTSHLSDIAYSGFSCFGFATQYEPLGHEYSAMLFSYISMLQNAGPRQPGSAKRDADATHL